MNNSLKKNPSRKDCEKIIKRILSTEILEKGKNQNFRFASDFMAFFESLYPPSDSLTKQVQRAIKSLDLPKDKDGFFVINKTKKQLSDEEELERIFKNSSASLSEQKFETVFLYINKKYLDYVYELIEGSESFKEIYITMIKSSNGIIFLTETKTRLEILLKSLLTK